MDFRTRFRLPPSPPKKSQSNTDSHTRNVVPPNKSQANTDSLTRNVVPPIKITPHKRCYFLFNLISAFTAELIFFSQDSAASQALDNPVNLCAAFTAELVFRRNLCAALRTYNSL